jgi:hypothetical protein
MSSSTKTRNWAVRPGFAFSAGAGAGAGLYVFDFLNRDDNRVYGMAFGGIGLAGGPGSGAWSTAGELAKKLATQAIIKLIGTAKGAYTHSGLAAGEQYATRKWTDFTPRESFSAEMLNWSSGRVTILGVSVVHHGAYGCFVSASNGLVSWSPMFSHVRVDILPQGLDVQVGVILGLWHLVFDIPNDS